MPRPEGTYHFPKGFLWGTATAAHQVEGQNTNNNWYAWENQPGHILEGQKAGLACDWWGGRWKEDFDRAAETGQNAHRMSIEWSRIQPTPDRWDEDALDYYRQMLRGLVDRNITPMVTLHHFTDPLWLGEMDGWENDRAPELFARFVRKAVDALKEYTNLWITVNEPNVYVYAGYIKAGGFPPGKNSLKLLGKALANLVRGHAAAYHVIHELQPEARVGTSIHYRSFKPYRSWIPMDHWLARMLARNSNDSFVQTTVDGRMPFMLGTMRIPEAIGTQDFVGVNYYSRDLISFDLTMPSQLFARRQYAREDELSPTGFIANVPAGMYESLAWARCFNLPIMVTENGVEDPDDQLRPRYTVEHLHQVWKAACNSFQVKGYFHWSLVDNFEWERGWTQRFGLWGLDTATQARIRRPSVDLYEAICKANAISSEMVEQWAPAAYDTLFPV